MKKFSMLFFVCLSILISTIIAQNKSSQIDELLQKYFEYNRLNGSVLVADKGEVILEKGYGTANREFNIPNSADTKFRIGSISKQFTAAIILQLVEEGKINLQGKITDYLPEYRKDTGEKITIHQLLNHTSGIISYTNLPNVWADSLRLPYEKDYFIEHFHSGDLEFEPGEKFVYNNTGYYLLAAIAEEVTGESFGDLLQTRLLDKAGMTNSGSEDDEFVISNAASGYLKRGPKFQKDPYMYMLNVMGAGHMYSTVGDLYKWDRALYTEKILSAEMKEKMFTPRLSNYGYGWLIQNMPGRDSTDSTIIHTHTGGINGFNTLEIRFPEEDRFLAVFTNTPGASLLEIALNIDKILNDKEYTFPKKPIGDHIYTVIMEDGIERAIETYNLLKKEETELFDFSEPELNTLGYSLLNEKMYDEAIEIFKLNIQEYPASANVYDSLGEAYMLKGENDKAIEFYTKSIEINPANENGKRMLKKLGVELTEDEVTVDPVVLQSYAGEYKLVEGFVFTVREEDGHLLVKATNQAEFEVFPLNETKFFYKVVDAQIEFNKNEEGVVESLTLFQNNQVMRAEKIKPENK
ncbi:MAG: serine hydrolase [Melioribacteraceae bacterium]|nr:serine hydrolase [Melioribacteraceae bacterium]